MRLFFALQLPAPAKEALRPALEAARKQGGAGVGLARVEQLHFTLAFLGEQPEEAVQRACEAAQAAGGLPAFRLGIGGRGAFPSLGRPRVLWLGVTQGAAELCAVADRLAAGLRERGFVPEDRPFRPHLTLGRVKPRGQEEARRALEAVPQGELARFPAREICLMQSVLGPSGATHTALRSFSLATAF
jgi:2'-5' RNA ligase